MDQETSRGDHQTTCSYPAYDVNDSYMLITHVDITEFTTKLGLVSVHQAFYQPHFTQLEQVEIEMATNSEQLRIYIYIYIYIYIDKIHPYRLCKEWQEY